MFRVYKREECGLHYANVLRQYRLSSKAHTLVEPKKCIVSPKFIRPWFCSIIFQSTMKSQAIFRVNHIEQIIDQLFTQQSADPTNIRALYIARGSKTPCCSRLQGATREPFSLIHSSAPGVGIDGAHFRQNPLWSPPKAAIAAAPAVLYNHTYTHTTWEGTFFAIVY